MNLFLGFCLCRCGGCFFDLVFLPNLYVEVSPLLTKTEKENRAKSKKGEKVITAINDVRK